MSTLRRLRNRIRKTRKLYDVELQSLPAKSTNLQLDCAVHVSTIFIETCRTEIEGVTGFVDVMNGHFGS